MNGRLAFWLQQHFVELNIRAVITVTTACCVVTLIVALGLPAMVQNGQRVKLLNVHTLLMEVQYFIQTYYQIQHRLPAEVDTQLFLQQRMRQSPLYRELLNSAQYTDRHLHLTLNYPDPKNTLLLSWRVDEIDGRLLWYCLDSGDARSGSAVNAANYLSFFCPNQ